MIVNSKQLLKKAQKEKYAVPHFNINNLEWCKSCIYGIYTRFYAFCMIQMYNYWNINLNIENLKKV